MSESSRLIRIECEYQCENEQVLRWRQASHARRHMLKGAGTRREISLLKRLHAALGSGGDALRNFKGDSAHLIVDQAVGGENDGAT